MIKITTAHIYKTYIRHRITRAAIISVRGIKVKLIEVR